MLHHNEHLALPRPAPFRLSSHSSGWHETLSIFGRRPGRTSAPSEQSIVALPCIISVTVRRGAICRALPLQSRLSCLAFLQSPSNRLLSRIGGERDTIPPYPSSGSRSGYVTDVAHEYMQIGGTMPPSPPLLPPEICTKVFILAPTVRHGSADFDHGRCTQPSR